LRWLHVLPNSIFDTVKFVFIKNQRCHIRVVGILAGYKKEISSERFVWGGRSLKWLIDTKTDDPELFHG